MVDDCRCGSCARDGGCPGGALGLGPPLSLLLVAVATHYLVGLDWTTSLLVGAILAPTDPVFASAIVGRNEVPARLRRLLNIESGVNDGLALPFVLVFLALATGAETGLGEIALELVLGVVFGVVLPLVVIALFRLPVLGAEPKLQPLGPLALAIVLYGLCHYTHANAYLAAFSAGITLATAAPRASHAFGEFGELASELTKFAAVLVFGALLTPAFFADLTLGEWAVALLSLLVVRPASVLLSLWRADLTRRERYAAAWFGPKGFASVVYGLLAVQSGIATAQTVFELVALVIALSIVAHSMTRRAGVESLRRRRARRTARRRPHGEQGEDCADPGQRPALIRRPEHPSEAPSVRSVWRTPPQRRSCRTR
jgi:NhaP-type Na+/H+ or K+/H+ antiporter